MKHLSFGLVMTSALFFFSACGGDDDGTGMVDDMGTDGLVLPDMDDAGGADDGVMDMDGPRNCIEQGFGVACNAATGCRIGNCQQELNFNPIGGDNDPIQDLPGGGNEVPGGTVYTDGMCTPDILLPETETADCLEEGGVDCGDCMTCVNALGGGACYTNCDPAAPGNDICRDAYDCVALNAGGGICFDGCERDTDCFGASIIREETNGIPGIQTGADCDEVPNPCGFAGPDQLIFIPSGNPTCNLDTFECEVDGNPTAQAGDPCRGDVQCEQDGSCQTERSFNLAEGDVTIFAGGYCFGPTCTSAADCNGDAVCGGARSDIWTDFTTTCLEGCDLTVGVDAADPATWINGRGGCAEGLKCMSDNTADDPELGVCVLDRVDPFSENGTFTQPFGAGPTTPNFGAACISDDECFNPFGYGGCTVGFNGRDGICTVDEAAVLEAAGFDVCPDDALVIATSAPDEGAQSSCAPTCDSPADCAEGFGCVDTADGSASFCSTTGCEDNADCRAGSSCIAGACFITCATPDTCDDGFGCLPLNDIFGVMDSDTICFDLCANDTQCPRAQGCAGETADTFGQCITECADATECAAGEACVDFDGATGGERQCRENCTEDGDCRTGETCSTETETCQPAV